MTAQTLRQMTHENLISYVRDRVSAPVVPAVSAPSVTDDPDRASSYLSMTGVPAALIVTYPKSHADRSTRSQRATRPAHKLLWDALGTVAAPTREPRYEDFLLVERRTLASSVA